MLGYKVTLTSPGGSAVDITADTMDLKFNWPATTDLPTCTLQVSNQTGRYTAFALYGQMAVTFPNNLGTFTFTYEKDDFNFTSVSGGGQNTGRVVIITATCSPELTFLTEGNLDVVGTDIAVGEFQARGTFYVPYASTLVSNLDTNLMDIGTIFYQLLHNTQPNQLTDYRGRGGYDATGAGLRSAAIGNLPAQVDYTHNSGSLGQLGLYVKGQWQVGLGSTGAQKTLLELMQNVATSNVIDGNGNPQTSDFYIDPTQSPPLLNAFQRMSVNSGVGFTVGQDPVMTPLDLPMETDSVKNFIIYWVNNEEVYPASGDNWSNYSTTSALTSQWLNVNSTGTGSFATDGSNTVSGTGFSNHYTNSSSSAGWVVLSTFDLGANGYQVLTQQTGRGLTAFTFYLMRKYNLVADSVTVFFYDYAGNYTQQAVSITTASVGAFARYSLPIPASGTGTVDGWIPTGTWNWATSQIAQVQFVLELGGATGDANQFWLDYINFVDDWYFAPVYSWNYFATAPSTLSGSSAVNAVQIAVNSTTGYVPGMFITINPGGGTQETRKILSVDAVGLTINVVQPLTYAHATNELFVGPAGGAGVSTLFANASAGALTIDVTAPGQWVPGMSIIIDPAGGSQEIVPITNATAQTITNSTSSSGQKVLTVNATAGFVVGYTVSINAVGQADYEQAVIGSISAGTSLTMVSNLTHTHGAAEVVSMLPMNGHAVNLSTSYNSGGGLVNNQTSTTTIVGATHDVNSVAAYGYRIYNFVDFYVSTGTSDSADAIAYNLLTTRKAKSSSGTITVSGYCAQHAAIKPGYIFTITDPNDVYVGSNVVDSTITGWVADSIEYDISKITGFTVTYTVEPYYGTILGTSPDKYSKDTFARRNRNVAAMLQRLNNASLPGGINSKR